MNESEVKEIIQHAQQQAIEDYESLPWYQQHLDISIPLFIFLIGLFQYVLRKWIAPVSQDVIQKLEDGIPTQGLIYHPGFGVFFMIVGIILLVLFQLFK